jgi:hypothetical protein
VYVVKNDYSENEVTYIHSHKPSAIAYHRLRTSEQPSLLVRREQECNNITLDVWDVLLLHTSQYTWDVLLLHTSQYTHHIQERMIY